jgi:hypothetical protein
LPGMRVAATYQRFAGCAFISHCMTPNSLGILEIFPNLPRPGNSWVTGGLKAGIE